MHSLPSPHFTHSKASALLISELNLSNYNLYDLMCLASYNFLELDVAIAYSLLRKGLISSGIKKYRKPTVGLNIGIK